MSDVLPPTRVHVIRATNGLRAGQRAWVAGDGVQELIDDGTFVEVSSRIEQRGRLWRVGQRNYSDRRDALRVSRALGVPMVEVA